MLRPVQARPAAANHRLPPRHPLALALGAKLQLVQEPGPPAVALQLGERQVGLPLRPGPLHPL